MATEKSAAVAAKEPKFTKEALMNSNRFRKECDLVSTLLEDGVEYSVSEVDAKIEKYMKGKVN